MAENGTAPPKTGDTGPERSQRNPTRTQTPTNKREYYKAGVLPGNGKRPLPSGSRSTSVEPIERPQTPTDHQPPPTDTTPQANRISTVDDSTHLREEQMDGPAYDFEEAEKIAKEFNLEFTTVNQRLFDTLRDVETIMTLQLDDIFEIHKWMAQIIGLAGLKVCSNSQWNAFSQCYNPTTGEVTPSKPEYGYMNSKNEPPGLRTEPGELEKTRAELASAQQVIKNLSEAIHNFSRAGNVNALQTESTNTMAQQTPKPPTHQPNHQTHA